MRIPDILSREVRISLECTQGGRCEAVANKWDISLAQAWKELKAEGWVISGRNVWCPKCAKEILHV